MNAQLGAALGIGALLAGILVALAGLIGTRGPARPSNRLGSVFRNILGSDLRPAARTRRRALLVGAAAVLTVGWMYSGIPVVGIGAAGAVLATPWLFGAGREDARMIARLEAIEIWTRRLADLVRSGSGLHQAIVVSAREAPAAISTEIAELATELRGDMPTTEALRRFADRLADASSDEVIAALMLNARERGPRLADVLDRVSESMADLVTMRREVSSGRTDARVSGQILSALTLVGLVVLLVNKTYMRPYHSTLGQGVLAMCMVAFGGLLMWCRQLNRPQRIPRLLRTGASRQTPTTVEQSWVS
jgi:Flp pilus assembly protein TadB